MLTLDIRSVGLPLVASGHHEIGSKRPIQPINEQVPRLFVGVGRGECAAGWKTG